MAKICVFCLMLTIRCWILMPRSKALAETLINYGIEPDARRYRPTTEINAELWQQLEKGQIRREN